MPRSPDKRSGPEGPPHLAAAKQANTTILADPVAPVAAEVAAVRRGDPDVCACCTSHAARKQALETLHRQSQRARISGELHQHAPLDRYARRPLRLVPLGQFALERWWGAA